MHNLEKEIENNTLFDKLNLNELSQAINDLKQNLIFIDTKPIQEKKEKINDLDQEEINELKKFTRNNYTIERNQLASELKKELHQTTSTKIELTKQKDKLKITLEKLSKIINITNNIEKELEINKQSLLKKLYNFFENRRLKINLDNHKNSTIILEKEIIENKNTINNLLEIRKIENALQKEEVRQKIQHFLEKNIVNWRQNCKKEEIQIKISEIEEYLSNLRESDLQNVMKKYNVFFVHGILPFYSVGHNSLLHEWADWKTKFKIMLAMSPTISGSSIKDGDPGNMWSSIGVLIDGGKIEGAFWSDYATVAESVQKRKKGSCCNIQDIKSQIKYSIEHRKNNDYNEFIISKPKVAGIYVLFSANEEEIYHIESYSNYGYRKLYISDIYNFAQESRLPLYIIKNGQLYDSKFEDYKLKISNHINKNDVLSGQNNKINDSIKTTFLKEIFNDSPFRLGSPEFENIYSRQDGKEMFDAFFLLNNPFYYYPDSPYRDYLFDNHNLKFQELEIFIHKEPTIGGEIFYYYTGNSLKKVKKMKIGIETYSSYLTKNDIFKDYKSGIFNITDDPFDFISKVQEKLKEMNNDSINKKLIQDIAFMLYGFAERAKEFGFEEIFQATFDIAKTYLKAEEYFDITERRINNKCQLKITEKDLEM